MNLIYQERVDEALRLLWFFSVLEDSDLAAIRDCIAGLGRLVCQSETLYRAIRREPRGVARGSE